MKPRFLCCLGLSLIFLGACATQQIEPPKTQLEIREFQTRSWPVKDIRMVMKAMLNVLQDDGFIAKNAVVDLGLLTATKEMDIQDSGEVFWNSIFMGDRALWRKNSVIDASANITGAGEETKVRINFSVKVFNNRGGVVEVKQIEDPKYYQDFFAKVDKGIFLQKEKL